MIGRPRARFRSTRSRPTQRQRSFHSPRERRSGQRIISRAKVRFVRSLQSWATHPNRSGRGRSDTGIRSNSRIGWRADHQLASGPNRRHRPAHDPGRRPAAIARAIACIARRTGCSVLASELRKSSSSPPVGLGASEFARDFIGDKPSRAHSTIDQHFEMVKQRLFYHRLASLFDAAVLHVLALYPSRSHPRVSSGCRHGRRNRNRQP